MTDKFDRPDLSAMKVNDLCSLMLKCAVSKDASDQMFAIACRNEIAKRKPVIDKPAPPEPKQ
jgi:hypothetical protein